MSSSNKSLNGQPSEEPRGKDLGVITKGKLLHDPTRALRLLLGVTGTMVLLASAYLALKGRFPANTRSVVAAMLGVLGLAASLIPHLRGRKLAVASLLLAAAGTAIRFSHEIPFAVPMMLNDGIPLFSFDLFYASALCVLLFCAHAFRGWPGPAPWWGRALTAAACSLAVLAWITPSKIDGFRRTHKDSMYGFPFMVDGELDSWQFNPLTVDGAPLLNLSTMRRALVAHAEFVHGIKTTTDRAQALFLSKDDFEPHQERIMRRAGLFGAQRFFSMVFLYLHVALLLLLLLAGAAMLVKAETAGRWAHTSLMGALWTVTIVPAAVNLMLFGCVCVSSLADWGDENQLPALLLSSAYLAAALIAALSGRVMASSARTNSGPESQAA